MAPIILNITRDTGRVHSEPGRCFQCLTYVDYIDDSGTKRRLVIEGVAGTRPAAEQRAEMHLESWKRRQTPPSPGTPF